jgi:hypothetical protein
MLFNSVYIRGWKFVYFTMSGCNSTDVLTQFLLHPCVIFLHTLFDCGRCVTLMCNYVALVYVCLVSLIFLLDCHIILFIYLRLK